MFITTAQVRAARALLDWNQSDLAQHAGLSKDHVANFELERSRSLDVLEKIHRALTKNGIMFTDGEGVRRRTYEIQVLEGQKGFWDFYDDIYETIRTDGGEMLIHNVDETLFTKWLGDKLLPHRERMRALDNFSQKIIICEGDTNFAANYRTTEYRWAPKKDFSTMPFYLYGQKLAMILFEPENVFIFVFEHPLIARSYRSLFMAAWELARIPYRPEEVTS